MIRSISKIFDIDEIRQFWNFQNLSLVDARLWPQLHHLMVVMTKNNNLLPFPNLFQYYKQLSQHESIVKTTDYDEATIRWGWEQARQEQGIGGANQQQQ